MPNKQDIEVENVTKVDTGIYPSQIAIRQNPAEREHDTAAAAMSLSTSTMPARVPKLIMTYQRINFHGDSMPLPVLSPELTPEFIPEQILDTRALTPVPSPRISEDDEPIRHATSEMLKPKRRVICPEVTIPGIALTRTLIDREVIHYITILAETDWESWSSFMNIPYLVALSELLNTVIHDTRIEEIKQIQEVINRYNKKIKENVSCKSILNSLFCCFGKSSIVHTEFSKAYFKDTNFLLRLENFSRQYLGYIDALTKIRPNLKISMPNCKIPDTSHPFYGDIYQLKMILSDNRNIPLLTARLVDELRIEGLKVRLAAAR